MVFLFLIAKVNYSIKNESWVKAFLIIICGYNDSGKRTGSLVSVLNKIFLLRFVSRTDIGKIQIIT